MSLFLALVRHFAQTPRWPRMVLIVSVLCGSVSAVRGGLAPFQPQGGGGGGGGASFGVMKTMVSALVGGKMIIEIYIDLIPTAGFT